MGIARRGIKDYDLADAFADQLFTRDFGINPGHKHFVFGSTDFALCIKGLMTATTASQTDKS